MRDNLVPVVVALLCIAAVALGAAALTSDLGGGGSSTPVIDSETNGSDSPSSSRGGNSATGGSLQPQGDDECVAGYNQSEMLYIVMAGVVAISLFVYVYTRELMAGVIAFPILMLPSLFLLIATAAFLGCPVPGQEAATSAAQGNGTWVPSSETINGGGEGSLSSRLQLLGGFLAISLVLFVMGFYVMRRNSKGESDEQTIENSEIAAAAEEAADEIERASTGKNPIYTAWAKMTEPLDVEHPETSTPQEFADAALAAGLNPDDVHELTELFETVRYGTTPVTAQHEKRAREALRRIQRDYSEAASDEETAGEEPSDSQPGPDSGAGDRGDE